MNHHQVVRVVCIQRSHHYQAMKNKLLQIDWQNKRKKRKKNKKKKKMKKTKKMTVI